ncbi:MAG: hypothetical protein ACPLRU_08425, partial [Desulfofundulus sp.]
MQVQEDHLPYPMVMNPLPFFRRVFLLEWKASGDPLYFMGHVSIIRFKDVFPYGGIRMRGRCAGWKRAGLWVFIA